MKQIPGKIIFKAIVGSQAYGTNTETSDTDIKGVYVQNIEDILGFHKYQPQIEVSKDETYFEIGRFLELCQKGNPNILELFYSPKDCILQTESEWMDLLQYREQFVTEECRNSFIGYAESQIKKASGIGKKFNYEATKMIRQEPLDFCHVILGTFIESKNLNLPKQGTIKLKDFLQRHNVHQENCIFNKLDHSQDVYQLYHCPDRITRGLQSENGNSIRIDSSDPDDSPIATVIFNVNAYSIHCKKYREYSDWLKNRNTQRYVDINEHGQKIDGKNMLHCIRLLRMGKEILEGKGIIVRRPDALELLDIRKGRYDLKEILKMAKTTMEELRNINTKLPSRIENNMINEILLKIRK